MFDGAKGREGSVVFFGRRSSRSPGSSRKLALSSPALSALLCQALHNVLTVSPSLSHSGGGSSVVSEANQTRWRAPN
ncbi:hypothetical protein J6590_027543 [Homalodisca vitripennis]|nr:hypothetical protein J6590_027543 [Homalodisca vitripennis]